MKIGVMSDTHGYLNDKVFKYFADCDEVWHAGDIGVNVIDDLVAFKMVRAVHGNIDDFSIVSQYPEDNVFACEGLKVWITHIGGHQPKYTGRVLDKLAVVKPDILVCGHSHLLCIKRDHEHGFLYINPGAAGRYGIQKVSTLVRFEVKGASISNMEVIELAGQR
jgi:putative phosphoesterase